MSELTSVSINESQPSQVTYSLWRTRQELKQVRRDLRSSCEQLGLVVSGVSEEDVSQEERNTEIRTLKLRETELVSQVESLTTVQHARFVNPSTLSTVGVAIVVLWVCQLLPSPESVVLSEELSQESFADLRAEMTSLVANEESRFLHLHGAREWDSLTQNQKAAFEQSVNDKLSQMFSKARLPEVRLDGSLRGHIANLEQLPPRYQQSSGKWLFSFRFDAEHSFLRSDHGLMFALYDDQGAVYAEGSLRLPVNVSQGERVLAAVVLSVHDEQNSLEQLQGFHLSYTEPQTELEQVVDTTKARKQMRYPRSRKVEVDPYANPLQLGAGIKVPMLQPQVARAGSTTGNGVRPSTYYPPQAGSTLNVYVPQSGSTLRPIRRGTYIPQTGSTLRIPAVSPKENRAWILPSGSTLSPSVAPW